MNPTMFQPKTIKQAMLPLLVVNCLLGMAVCDFKLKRHGKLLENGYTAVFLVLINVAAYLTLRYQTKYFLKNDPNVNRNIFLSTYYANLLLINTLMVISRINWKNLQKTIVLAEVFDQKMEKLGSPKNYRKIFLQQTKAYVLSAIMVIVFAFIFYKWHFHVSTPIIVKLWVVSVLHCQLYIICVCNISFCQWIKYLEMKFQQLSQLLRGMLKTTPESPQHKQALGMRYDFQKKNVTMFRDERVQGSDEDTDVIRKAKQLHLDLIKIARTVNAAYGLHMMVVMVISFIFTTVLLYEFYRILWLNIPTVQFFHIAVDLACSIISFSWQIFYVNHVCARTSTEAENIGDIICELYEPSTSTEFRAEIRDFTLQLIQNPLVFTACGFFEMDYTFIQRVIGSITTYLVILIQVGDMTKARFSNSTVSAIRNQTLSPTVLNSA